MELNQLHQHCSSPFLTVSFNSAVQKLFWSALLLCSFLGLKIDFLKKLIYLFFPFLLCLAFSLSGVSRLISDLGALCCAHTLFTSTVSLLLEKREEPSAGNTKVILYWKSRCRCICLSNFETGKEGLCCTQDILRIYKQGH